MIGHVGSICCLAKIKSPKTLSILASGSDHEDCSIIIWDVEKKSIIRKLLGHQAAVVSLICLGDYKHIVSASYDKNIRIWNLAENKTSYVLGDHGVCFI